VSIHSPDILEDDMAQKLKQWVEKLAESDEGKATLDKVGRISMRSRIRRNRWVLGGRDGGWRQNVEEDLDDEDNHHRTSSAGHYFRYASAEIQHPFDQHPNLNLARIG
jgi:muconolactone delta-isomerase